ncbi:glycosyltransferase [Brevibacterium sp. 5221]|uniref:Glycosyltransferase n=1 Tax=Brevibacterium rongguiense TaxID=2695267 RepID=A0A6N9H5L0_9MICO|nr:MULTISPECIES: galactosyltransferase-related protein [Brevibacterium]MYM18894.1 glycosyltransferase [Brevibacterium rongguiense]WAL39411.1 galactosyltransferase-related protein [Brevibacterium sp. BRM-1]
MRVEVLTLATPDRLHRVLAQHAALAAAPPARHRVAVLSPSPSDLAAQRLPSSMTPLHVPARGRLPLARARNALAEAGSREGADLLVFLDADCLPAPGFLPALEAAAVREPDALLTGPVTYLTQAQTDPRLALGQRAASTPGPDPIAAMTAIRRPHPARPDPPAGTLQAVRAAEAAEADYALFWSLAFALRPRTFARIGGFCEDYCGYGGEDTDFALCARRAGADLVWAGGAAAVHLYHPVSRPPVEHLEDIVANARLFFRRWGHWPMRGWLEAFAAAGLVDYDPRAAGPEAGLRLRRSR